MCIFFELKEVFSDSFSDQSKAISPFLYAGGDFFSTSNHFTGRGLLMNSRNFAEAPVGYKLNHLGSKVFAPAKPI